MKVKIFILADEHCIKIKATGFFFENFIGQLG